MKSYSAPFTVAIDGLSSSGKGMLAKAVAGIFGFCHLDTGKVYRVFAEEMKHRDFLDGEEVIISTSERCRILELALSDDPKYGTERVGKAASVIGRNKAVRALLLEVQQEFIKSSKNGVVVDGRDIGTVVCPEAHVKVFVTAYTSVRARRRFKQLKLSGNTKRLMYKCVFSHLLQRDIRDSTRKTAPLVRTEEAFYLNNSHMSKEETVAALVKKIKTFL